MAQVSDLIIHHPEINSYRDFEDVVIAAAKAGETFLIFDIKPDYRDTPRDWQWRLEAIFNRADRLSSPLQNPQQSEEP